MKSQTRIQVYMALQTEIWLRYQETREIINGRWMV